MSTEMSTASSVEIEEYCDAVRIALADLPADVSDDLIEDLPDHLGEVLAEGDGTLRERLGEPAAYAAELRAAAGIDAIQPPGGRGIRAGLAALVRQGRTNADRFDERLGRLLGYPRVMELLHALRPGWWVLRGWIVAQLICGVGHSGQWRGLVPSLQGSKLSGLGLTVVAVVASVWIGRRSSDLDPWPRGLVFVASAAIATWALIVLPSAVGDVNTVYVSPASSAPADSYPDLTDVYVYDQNGQPVVGARLYDQSGNPLQLGAGVCLDGNPAPGSYPDTYNADGTQPDWTYPLCPNDPGPFRSGPGPVTPGGGAPSASSATPTTPPVTASKSAPGTSPTKSPPR